MTVPYALIGRADDGGLGQQTVELARHVPPERVLVVDLGERGRGATRPERYECDQLRIAPGPEITAADWRWVTAGAPTLFAAETGYHDDWCEAARARGVRSVLQANPELYGGDRPDVLTVPTPWEARRLPSPVVVPVPVARDRLPPREVPSTVTTFFHPQAPAMLDRNGTRIVETAARFIRQPVRIVIGTTAVQRPQERQIGRCVIERRPPSRDYWSAYPEDCSALILPRRYGGLCLPAQEAASLGWPILTTALPPQTAWLPPQHMVAARPWRQRVRMVGGRFDVATVHPAELAAAIDRMATDAQLVAAMSEASGSWAASLDWSLWADRYASLLSGATEWAA